MNFSRIVAIASTAALLTACNQPGGMPNSGVMNGGGVNNQDVGTVAGVVGGGVLGSLVGRGNGKIAGAIVGAGLGGLIGNSIGKSLDNADRAAAEQNAQRALETAPPGQPLPWNNPNSGHSGTFTPSGYYQTASGQYCREFTQTIQVGGQTQQGHGTACRMPDGSWQITQ